MAQWIETDEVWRRNQKMHQTEAIRLLANLLLLALLAGLPSRTCAADIQHQKCFVNSIGAKLVRVPSGSFLKGSSFSEQTRDSWEGQPRRTTISKSFFLAETETTQSQFAKIMSYNPSRFVSSCRPVENVSWKEAIKFCELLTRLEQDKKRITSNQKYSLPTEAQWEFACRAGSSTQFSTGKELPQKSSKFDYFGASRKVLGFSSHIIDRKRAAYYLEQKYGARAVSMLRHYWVGTAKVASYEPNSFGLFDMHGNVWEWCLDRYEAVPNTNDNSASIHHADSGLLRCIKGGSWDNYDFDCRSAKRRFFDSNYKCDNIGFRFVLVEE